MRTSGAGLAQRSGLCKRRISVQASETLVNHLVGAGFDPKYGARSMQRTVEYLVVAALAEALAADPGLNSAELLLDWEDGAVKIERA